MGPVDIYAESRGRLFELAPQLDEAALGTPLQATPPWTVLDGYRHLTGVCANVLDGVMDGAGSPDWTAAQLACRADCSVTEVVEEWGRRAPDIEARMREAGEGMSFMAFDAFTHEQDIRAAVGQRGLRDIAAVPVLADLALRTFGTRYAKSGAPAVTVVTGDQAHTLGEGAPAVTLRTTPYELLRIVFGRRSPHQVEAAGWEGEPAEVIDAFHLFDFPTRDITD
jgi:uncharacterized protein (TIGR03083 family)